MADQQPGAITLASRGVTRDDMATIMSAPVAPTATTVAMTTSAPVAAPAQTAAAVPAGTATAVPAADAPEQLVVVRASLVRSISQARPVVAVPGRRRGRELGVRAHLQRRVVRGGPAALAHGHRHVRLEAQAVQLVAELLEVAAALLGALARAVAVFVLSFRARDAAAGVHAAA